MQASKKGLEQEMFRDPNTPSIWLQLRMEGSTRTFELASENERAIVVGSLMRADVRIDEPGIALVHFHFERDGYLVYLVPGYAAEVRVHGQRITEPCPIRGQALVEFGSHWMQVQVLEHAPRDSDAELSVRRDEPTPDALGEYGDRTTVAVRPYEPPRGRCDEPPAENRAPSPVLLQHVLAPRIAEVGRGGLGADAGSCTPPSASAPVLRGAVRDARCTDTVPNESAPSVRFVAANPRRRHFARTLLVLCLVLVALALLVFIVVVRRAWPASLQSVESATSR